jgi:hypothetical protein
MLLMPSGTSTSSGMGIYRGGTLFASIRNGVFRCPNLGEDPRPMEIPDGPKGTLRAGALC